MLENTLGEILKHRRILIQALDNPSAVIITAIKAELETTNILTKKITEVIEKLEAKIFGKT